MESKCFQDKLSQYTVGRPSKPFIDHNLQIHLPSSDGPQKQANSSHSPIYTHYAGSLPSSHSTSAINEAELNHAIREAERSYEAWKKMQLKLREAVEVLQK